MQEMRNPDGLTASCWCERFVLDRVTDFNRCRWSCATSAPTGTTPIGSWSSGSSPWSRNWMNWVAVSIRRPSCSLRSCSAAVRRAGEGDVSQIPTNTINLLKMPFLNFFFLQVTWVQTQSQIIISSVSIRIHKRQAANPLQPELLQTLHILNHLEDWHTY